MDPVFSGTNCLHLLLFAGIMFKQLKTEESSHPLLKPLESLQTFLNTSAAVLIHAQHRVNVFVAVKAA